MVWQKESTKIMKINMTAIKIETIIAIAVTAMLCVHYSKAYFSHALILFALFFIYICIKEGRREISARLGKTDSPARLFTISLVLFYGTLFISAAVNRDAAGFRTGLSYAALAVPFFMTYTLGHLTKSEIGERCGFLLAGFVICAYAFIAHDAPYKERLFSFFAHPNHLGTYTALFLPFVFLYIYRTKALTEKIALGILAALLLCCLWKSGSRGAMAALAGGLALSSLTLLFLKRKSLSAKKSFAAFFVAILLLSAGGALVSHITEDRMQRPEAFTSQALARSKTGGERVLMWQASIKMWETHKISGIGLANWETAYYSDTYHPQKGIEKDLDMPHNMPLYFLSTAGAIGAAGYAAFLLLSFAALCKSLRTTTDPFFTAAALSASFTFAIQSLVDTTIINTIPARIYFALMGYYFSCHSVLDKDVNKNG